MSYGLVVCSACRREAHAGAGGWFHCNDATPLCNGASAVWPSSTEENCGAGDLP